MKGTSTEQAQVFVDKCHFYKAEAYLGGGSIYIQQTRIRGLFNNKFAA